MYSIEEHTSNHSLDNGLISKNTNTSFKAQQQTTLQQKQSHQ